MQWEQLWVVLRKRFGAYLGWLTANLGGLIVAYLASFTVWTFHRDFGNYLPAPEAVLITGTISLAVAGASYRSLPPDYAASLSPALSTLWPFLLGGVYGVLIAMGVKPPVISKATIWFIAAVIAAGCIFWASLTWLHAQGLRMDLEQEPAPPAPPSQALQEVAAQLPKIEPGIGPAEETQNEHSRNTSN